jgi:1-acyl-sn-glycerol-3-phosphate acyltransferase
MQNQPSLPAKPVTEIWRPDLVVLPRLTFARRAFRAFTRGTTKLLAFFTMRATITGLENFPKHGPALVVINHLGDADAVLIMATLPIAIEGMGKIELNEHWFIGPVFRAYGIIWVHRGRPDRKALRAALDGLAGGRMIALAPEGRQSLIGGLEDGNAGATFLALKSGVPIVPIALTGTENQSIYGHMRRFKRAPVTLSVGKPFVLFPKGKQADRQEMMRDGTRQIMETLAGLLPEAYRGKYKTTQAK